MAINRHNLAILCLAPVCGLLWGWNTVEMRHNGLLETVPNIAALGQSPYGKTVAMAIQGPVDEYWHKGRESHHGHSHAEGEECNHQEQGNDAGEMDADAGAGHDGASLPLLAKAKEYVEELGAAVAEPNTKVGLTAAHERYLHRQIERKLEAAYWFDPGNFANYNALHLFLSEEALASRKLNPTRVMALADRTRAYVEKEKVNPEPWLTAASAVNGKLEFVFRLRAERPGAKEEFALLVKDFEHCLARYAFLRDYQMASGRWEAVSAARREAMEVRATMLTRLCEAQAIISRERFDTPPAR